MYNTKQIRKTFSIMEKCELVIRQDFKCVGHHCKGNIKLPNNFQIDHIFSLNKCLLLLRDNIAFDKADTMHNKIMKIKSEPHQTKRIKLIYQVLNCMENLQLLCGSCHDYKTCQEKQQLKIQQQLKYITEHIDNIHYWNKNINQETPIYLNSCKIDCNIYQPLRNVVKTAFKFPCEAITPSSRCKGVATSQSINDPSRPNMCYHCNIQRINRKIYLAKKEKNK